VRLIGTGLTMVDVAIAAAAHNPDSAIHASVLAPINA